MKHIKNDTKKVFLSKGACSHTFFHILNREFGYLKENEECASDPLAGGIFQQGYQCGMLWGAALAVGAESFRRNDDHGKAIAQAIKATQLVMESFINRTKSPDCLDITKCDLTTRFGMTKLMVKTFLGGFIYSHCFNLSEKWTSEAIRSAKEGLSLELSEFSQLPLSCASEIVKKMGASDEEMLMVAGFAGGLGLSGNACGALAAAIWMNTLTRVRDHKYKYTLSDTVPKKILRAFHEETCYEMECCKITGRRFDSIEEHTEFIMNGGCKKLINVLAASSSHS